MADSNSIRVMYIFEIGARLKSSAEVICLAAHLYHRFFRIKPEMDRYELFTFGAACIKLAYMFHEESLDTGDLALVMASITHRTSQVLEARTKSKIESSIELASKIVAINLDYEINNKDTRMMTPGELLLARGSNFNQPTDELFKEPASSDSEISDYDEKEESTDRLLLGNSKNLISSHRYLTHFLKSIKLLVGTESKESFEKVGNVAWIFMNDFYWSPCVTQHYVNHIACACLMMSIETFRKELECSKNRAKANLWNLLDKKWNLIFCHDLDQIKLDYIIGVIVKQYKEYDRILEHELSTYVIDPAKGEQVASAQRIP